MLGALLSPNRSSLSGVGVRVVLISILALYFAGRILQVLPFSTPSVLIVALEILSALAFALVHGAIHYGLRGILVFAAICLVIGNAMEHLGVATGIPYGGYEFLPLMGPQFYRVPVLLGFAYIGMAWVSWTLARLILHVTRVDLTGRELVTLPLLASVIMTAWDSAQDPVWSTLLHAWRWHDGGIWFGVPLTNYVGWLLTMFLIYAAFALYLRASSTTVQVPAYPHWGAAISFYSLCALGNVLQILRPQPILVVADPAGVLWHAYAILHASALVSIFIMGSFALAAWVRTTSLVAAAKD